LARFVLIVLTMKKTMNPKLVLNRETVRKMSREQMSQVGGGASITCAGCPRSGGYQVDVGQSTDARCSDATHCGSCPQSCIYACGILVAVVG
jgi:hypothetical protein